MPFPIPITIRDIRPSDKALLSDGLSHLSAASAYARFLSAKPRFTAAELRYLTELDGVNHVGLIAFDARRPNVMAAVGRFVREADDPQTAEVGIVVADHLHGRGIGTIVGLELAERARALGIKRFSAIMLPENTAALALFRRISDHLHTELHDGVRELVADIAA